MLLLQSLPDAWLCVQAQAKGVRLTSAAYMTQLPYGPPAIACERGTRLHGRPLQ